MSDLKHLMVLISHGTIETMVVNILLLHILPAKEIVNLYEKDVKFFFC